MKTQATVIFLVLTIAVPAISDILEVPGQYPTIQGAIDAAAPGDEVRVDPGTYVENLQIIGKEIVVRSSQGPGNTILDGSGAPYPYLSASTVFLDGVGPGAVVEGFTITGGKGSLWHNNIEQIGGGVCCWDYTSPTIRNNIITANTVLGPSYGNGAGVACSPFSAPVIEGNFIFENEAFGGSFGAGGGIACGHNTQAVIRNNVIHRNSAGGVPGGAGCGTSGNPFMGRLPREAGLGSLPGVGGGIAVGEDSNTSILNNTICDNEALYGVGGGIACVYSASPEVENSIFWDNHADLYGKEIAVLGFFAIRYSDVEGGKSSVYVPTGSVLDWGPGMIDANPLFQDPDHGDYHLTAASPCLDAGNNGAAGLPEEDMEGDPRVVKGRYPEWGGWITAPGGLKPAKGVVDMGADEYYVLHKQKTQ